MTRASTHAHYGSWRLGVDGVIDANANEKALTGGGGAGMLLGLYNMLRISVRRCRTTARRRDVPANGLRIMDGPALTLRMPRSLGISLQSRDRV